MRRAASGQRRTRCARPPTTNQSRSQTWYSSMTDIEGCAFNWSRAWFERLKTAEHVFVVRSQREVESRAQRCLGLVQRNGEWGTVVGIPVNFPLAYDDGMRWSEMVGRPVSFTETCWGVDMSTCRQASGVTDSHAGPEPRGVDRDRPGGASGVVADGSVW